MMKNKLILAIDCATPLSSVCISEGEKILACMKIMPKMGHSETLVPTIEYLLNSLSLKINDFDVISATIGPGTFTGIRVGISTAEGLLIPWRIKTVGVRTTLAIALSIGRYIERPAVIIDARRGMAYIERFIWEDGDEMPRAEGDIMLVQYEKIKDTVLGYTSIALREQETYKLICDSGLSPVPVLAPIACGVVVVANYYIKNNVEAPLKPLYIREPN
ncbi:MAG: tRNA (adenosine(37)-N6)-threonylcarbamoyltransferase complex dimerization subunit type 1 TsaB [bacterium]